MYSVHRGSQRGIKYIVYYFLSSSFSTCSSLPSYSMWSVWGTGIKKAFNNHIQCDGSGLGLYPYPSRSGTLRCMGRGDVRPLLWFFCPFLKISLRKEFLALQNFLLRMPIWKKISENRPCMRGSIPQKIRYNICWPFRMKTIKTAVFHNLAA